MKKVLYVFAGLAACLFASAGNRDYRESFLEQLQKRDSVLVGDRLEYGFVLKNVGEGLVLGLPDFSNGFRDSVEVVRQWQTDTISVHKNKGGKSYDLKYGIQITSFEEGRFTLPELAAVRRTADGEDTLWFDAKVLEVRPMAVDSTSIANTNDFKDIVRYPLTFKEVWPYILAVLLFTVLVFFAVKWIRKAIARKREVGYDEPAHIVALRKLDKFRGSKFWAPDKQKAFYSGVTDTVREYVSKRYEIGAMEMTTAEIKDALKDKDIQDDLREGLLSLFQSADFVKFAKMTLTDEDNAKVIPFAVRFVSETYRETLAEAQVKDKEEGGDVL